MPESRSRRLEVRLTRTAQRDIKAILNWSRKEFGEAAAVRYNALIKQALRDIAADPERQRRRTFTRWRILLCIRQIVMSAELAEVG